MFYTSGTLFRKGRKIFVIATMGLFSGDEAGNCIVGETCCRAGDNRKIFMRMSNEYWHIMLEI